jgi:hypothetical protein
MTSPPHFALLAARGRGRGVLTTLDENDETTVT